MRKQMDLRDFKYDIVGTRESEKLLMSHKMSIIPSCSNRYILELLYIGPTTDPFNTLHKTLN